MPAVTLTPDDLAPFVEIAEEKAEAMIEDALGMAQMLAPCIFDDAFEFAPAAKAVLRGAVLRWNESGQGGVTQLTALGFGQSFDNSQPRRTMFTSTEIAQLQGMCSSTSTAFAIDTAPECASTHADICALAFGAQYCSCGAELTLAGPLWETP